jgi:hypothetical protein
MSECFAGFQRSRRDVTVTVGLFDMHNRRKSSMPKLFKVMIMLLSGLLAAGIWVDATMKHALARPNYAKWWLEAYPDVAKKNEVGDGKAVNKCNVCHIGTKSKKDRNAYAKAIEKALAPKKNLRPSDKKLFEETLKDVAKEKSDTEGKTFGDLLDAGMLPATPK